MLKITTIIDAGLREGPKQDESEEKTARGVIYIAGPIKGHADYIERFCAAQLDLEARGWIVLNPADLPAGMPAERYMPICLAMLQQADAIFMLDDWEKSDGANIELQFALYQGKTICWKVEEEK